MEVLLNIHSKSIEFLLKDKVTQSLFRYSLTDLCVCTSESGKKRMNGKFLLFYEIKIILKKIFLCLNQSKTFFTKRMEETWKMGEKISTVAALWLRPGCASSPRRIKVRNTGKKITENMRILHAIYSSIIDGYY